MLRRMLALPAADRRLLLLAASLQLLIAGLLRALPFGWLRRALRVWRWLPAMGLNAVDAEARIVRAVSVSSAHLGHWSTCLASALTAELLARLAGCDAKVRIGIAPAADRRARFQAHAWVESDGRVLCGAVVPWTYAPLSHAARRVGDAE